MDRGAARALICAVLCAWVSIASLGASDTRARTPAEIERRLADIALRLTSIEQEEAIIAAWQATLPALIESAAADASILAAIEIRRQEHAARLGVLARERAELEQERAMLAAMPTRSTSGPLQPADPQGMTPFDLTGQVTAGQSFNPAISVIPDVAYYTDTRGGAAGDVLAGAAALAHTSHAEGESDAHGHSSLERGFNLREVELAFSGAVDPYFDVWATFSIGPDGLDTEEAYVQTRKFLPGVQVRVGRFFSGVGYVNRQHPHQWDFVDQALVYDALLGGNIGEVGVQATWLPPLPVYAQFGVEALQGENTGVARQAGEAYRDVLAPTAGPRLFTAFVKVAPDVGYSNAVQGGVSFGRSRGHQEVLAGSEGELLEALEGTAWFAGTDWIWRHDSPRPFGRGDVTVQGEYLHRRKTLSAVDLGEAVRTGARVDSSQDGLYAQVTYGFAQRWTVGGRVDVLAAIDSTPAGLADHAFDGSQRYSAAVTFNPTEFSRLRVQYAGGVAHQDGRQTTQQVFVQFQMSLGAHGAHRF